jgi:GNAT superfamily N-acetyltransferase
MITCTALPLADIALGAPLRRLIRDELTKPGSDFHKAIETKTDGHIAIVWADAVAVGWARTEHWYDGNGIPYDTLEAFVRPDHRLKGIAVLAACGICSSALCENGGVVAVFHPHMLLVARRAGFFPTLFERDERGWWKRV